MTQRSHPNPLSPRQLEVCELIAQGLENDEIARALTIAPRTVHAHIACVMKKLQVSNRTKIAIWWFVNISIPDLLSHSVNKT